MYHLFGLLFSCIKSGLMSMVSCLVSSRVEFLPVLAHLQSAEVPNEM